MFAMGLGAAFSKRTTAANYLSRAGSLFILGVIVNFFEQYIPAILVPDTLGPLNEVCHSILATDIYSFAALGSLYFALMKKTGVQKIFTDLKQCFACRSLFVHQYCCWAVCFHC